MSSEKALHVREVRAIRREMKMEMVEKIKNERAKRSPQEQLARLDKLLRRGQGATKERAKLRALIEKEKAEEKR